MPRTLFIDADACPVTRESIDCARRAGVAVVIAGNSTQNLERHIRRDDPRDAEHARRGFWVKKVLSSWGLVLSGLGKGLNSTTVPFILLGPFARQVKNLLLSITIQKLYLLTLIHLTPSTLNH